MFIPEMTMEEFATGLKATRTVLIPYGSTEEHGRHLPLDTDTLQALEVGLKTAARKDLFVTAPIHYGVCRSSRNHPGTLGIRSETLKALTSDLVSSLYRQGLRNFVLLSGHAGGTHMMALTDSGETLLDEYHDLEIAVVCEYELVRHCANDLILTSGDSHAGEIETSRILSSHPYLVKGTDREEYPDFPFGILVRDKRACWPGGVWGDPGQASAEKGAAIEERVVLRLVQLIEELENRNHGRNRR